MKILIVKTSSLGDILQAFYALSYIKTFMPDAQVHWLAEKPMEGLLKAHPDIKRVWTIDSHTWRKNPFSLSSYRSIMKLKKELKSHVYDRVIDLQGNIKSGLCLALCKGKKVGFCRASAAEWPNTLFTHQRYTPPKGFNIRQDYLFLVQKALGLERPPLATPSLKLKILESEKKAIDSALKKAIPGFQKVVIALGSKWENKKMKAKDMAILLKGSLKLEKAFFFVLYGNDSEKKEAEAFASCFPSSSQLLSPLSLPALQNFMHACDLVISMDSMPLHLAALSHSATLSFFGPSSANKYAPVGKEHRSLQGRCPYGVVFEKRCEKLRKCSTGACLKDLSNLPLP